MIDPMGFHPAEGLLSDEMICKGLSRVAKADMWKCCPAWQSFG